jgi:dTDP-4-dehydrorhamnose 3,5-epimerase
VPTGCAHSFCTLQPDTGVAYRCSDYYAPEAESGLLWCDPALALPWPVGEAEAIVAERDRRWPRLADLSPIFD